jgi:putative ABC transport system substrate-binding protein
LANAKNPYGQILWQETEPAARALDLEPMLFQMQKLGDLPATFHEMEDKDANALIIVSDALFNSARRQIVALAAEHRLLAMYAGPKFVEDGGLISYGPNIVEMTRRSAAFVDKILKGANPTDLPIPRASNLPSTRSLRRLLASAFHRFCSPAPMR